MIAWLKSLWHKWSKEGLEVPFIKSQVQNQPSIMLTFAYITFALAVLSVIALHFKASLAVATWTSLGFWVMAVVLYMMRSLSKAKFDLDDKSISFESEKEEIKKDIESK